jgi:lipopolysaccharide export system permease protein
MKKIIFKNISLDHIKFFLLCIITISSIIWVLQAVNYLDFVIEDGHGFFVYIKYTLFSYPRIISRVFPFIVFFSLIYILLKYEYKNELVIFWNFGIEKIKFINFFIKISAFFLFFNLLLNSIIVPSSQDKARSYIRSSDLDFFSSILKPKKFIDVVQNLTIYFESKTVDGNLKNIILKDNSVKNGYQLTFAKNGMFEFRNGKKILILLNGKTIYKNSNNVSEFKFDRTIFNIDKFSSATTGQTKTQENSTYELSKCLFKLKNIEITESNIMDTHGFNNCRLKNLKNIFQELYRRLVLPFYNPSIFMLGLLLILKSKDELFYNRYKFKVFILGCVFIIFLEASTKLIGSNFFQNYLIFFLPTFFYIIIYLYLIKKLSLKE